MKTIAIKGDLRNKMGKAANKALHHEGKVPCVVYGGKENTHFSVYESDFKNLVYTPNAYLVRLDIEGKKTMAKLQEMQFHPVSEAIIHADFMEIFEDKPVRMAIPVKIVGNSPGVRAGGNLQTKMKKINVLALITDLPEFIEVNIDDLEIGKNIRVKQLTATNCTILDSPENSVITCSATRASAAVEEVAS